MTILAGAVILSLSDSKIFEKASDAVNKYNDKQQQVLDNLNCLEDWENCIDGKEPDDDYEEIIPNESIEGSITIDGIKYQITRGVAKVVGVETEVTSAKIPRKIEYLETICPVRSIGDEAFYNKMLAMVENLLKDLN